MGARWVVALDGSPNWGGLSRRFGQVTACRFGSIRLVVGPDRRAGRLGRACRVGRTGNGLRLACRKEVKWIGVISPVMLVRLVWAWHVEQTRVDAKCRSGEAGRDGAGRGVRSRWFGRCRRVRTRGRGVAKTGIGLTRRDLSRGAVRQVVQARLDLSSRHDGGQTGVVARGASGSS